MRSRSVERGDVREAVRRGLSLGDDGGNEWWMEARCRGRNPASWFPTDTDPDGPLWETRLICSGCPVAKACLADALVRNDRYGVWGGATAAERAVIRADLLAGRRIEELDLTHA